MPTLHALLVGIDNYPGKASLRHANSDAHSVKDYLNSHLNRAAGFRLEPKILVNGQAKKKAVIAAFQHFQAAKGSDVCLFYFAGHGSELVEPPDKLEHLTKATGKFETIVCHDSRGNGGSDLTDQELAHLIGTTVKKIRFSGNGHFAVIMDCCHSGHGTRLESDGQLLASRSVESRHSQRVEDFYGYTGTGPYPVTGKHVQLAACRHRQDAWDGKYTPALLDELICNGATRTYSNIHEAVKSTVHHLMKGHQTPDFYANPSRLMQLPFLGGAVR